METEDDDLLALRSAALASLSAKIPKKEVKEEEEDLESLRLAALMTRRQNQKIEVIYKLPVHQHQKPHVNPAMFRKPWTTTNLISLTPDPNAGNVQRTNKMSVTEMQQSTRKAIARNVPGTIESKVQDKFSRYNSDSSSDDEDEHLEKKKNGESDEDAGHSDAESVKSAKSFSSVSDVEESEDKAVDDENTQEKSDHSDGEKKVNEAVKTEEGNSDDISIIEDEEEDILAAIDDFLEDRPEKEKPKKKEKKCTTEIEQNAVKKSSASNVPTVPNSRESSTSSKSSTKEEKSGKMKKKSSTAVTKPVTLSREGSKKNSPEPLKKRMPATKTQTSRLANHSEHSLHIQKRKTRNHEATTKPENKPEQPVIPPLMSLNLSPARKRRDSDLDSVGTSDLSFLSSDEEDEIKAQPENKDKRKAKMRTDNLKRQNQSQDTNENSRRRGTNNRNKNHQQGKKQKTEGALFREKNVSQEEKLQKDKAGDLRKKLESRGLVKKPLASKSEPSQENARSVKIPSSTKVLTKEPLEPLKPVTKRGIINLKQRSSRIADKDRQEVRSGPTSRESPHISLPDLKEARRIIITRPNIRQPATRVKGSSDKSYESSTDMKSKCSVDIRERPRKWNDSSRRERIQDADDSHKQTTEPLMKKRSVLPPNTPTERKRQKLEEVGSSRRQTVNSPVQESRLEESDRDVDGSTSTDDSSSEDEGEVIEEEEIFTFDASSLPLYDEVLGSVGDGEYVTDEKKKDRKSSQSKSKRRKKSISSSNRASNIRIPDSRRIVPKSSRDGPKIENVISETSEKTRKISVHQRLGLPLDEKKLSKAAATKSIVRGTSARSWSSSRSWSQEGSPRILRESDDDDDFYLELESKEESVFKPKKRSAYINPESLNPSSSKKSRKGRDTRSQNSKRKIKVSTKKNIDGRNSNRPTQIQENADVPKTTNVKGRLGKVILSSVLCQPPASSENRRVVKSSAIASVRSSKKKSSKRSKQRDRGRNGGGKGEDCLEDRIRRIKEQNGLILKRQKEIELEKEKFGF